MEAEGENGNDDPQHFGQTQVNTENPFKDFFHNAVEDVSAFYDKVSAKFDSWGSDVKEQFGKMVEDGRNLRVSTVSKMIARGIKGQDAFQEIGHEYTDHCATVDKDPLSFEEFFKHTTFFNGEGDWPTFEHLHTDLGEEPNLDSYLTLRRDARTPNMQTQLN